MRAPIDAIVKRKGKTRIGKGFSRAELREAGFSVRKARSWGIPVDVRRSSKHKENVQILKEA